MKRGFALVVCLVLLAPLLGACGGGAGALPSEAAATPEPVCVQKLCIKESRLTEPGGALDRVRHVEGVLVNEGDTRYARVEITFTLLDKAGKELGEASARVDDLGPGERWRFKCRIPASIEVATQSYKLKELKGS